MNLHNIEFIQNEAMQDHFSAKRVFNESGAIFFSVYKQHRDMKVSGVSHEDDYKGNAMAAMLAPGIIEIRFHKNYADARVTSITKTLLSNPALSFMKD